MVQISENSDESDNLTHSTLTQINFTFFIILSTTIHILDIGNKTEHAYS